VIRYNSGLITMPSCNLTNSCRHYYWHYVAFLWARKVICTSFPLGIFFVNFEMVPYILTYKSLSRISRPPKNRVHISSKIIDPRISRRWLLRPCTGCKRRSAEAYTKIVCTGRRLQRRRVGEGCGVGVTADA